MSFLKTILCAGAMFGMSHAAVQSVTVGDVDDFNNVDGDGVADLVDGEFLAGLINIGSPDGDLTDESITSAVARSFDFDFNFVGGTTQSASISIFHADVDRAGRGFDVAEIRIDNQLTSFSLSTVPQVLNASGTFFRHDVFTLDPTQLSLLDDGMLRFSIIINTPDTVDIDGIAIDYITLNVTNTAVPLPAAALLFGPMIGFIARRRGGPQRS